MDLSLLNPQQLEAVLTTEGPLLILAGAGSGKTSVLVHRIAYLIEEEGVSPARILAITFTNKAARELADRLSEMVGAAGARIWARTFHSACLQILRFEVEATDLRPNFVIYDTSDQLSILKRILKHRNIDADVLRPGAVLATISHIKNTYFDLEEGLARYSAEGLLPEQTAAVIGDYQRTLVENNAVDFDDILCKTVALFKAHPDILARYQDRFRYILVDEYQDTNPIQYALIHLLAAANRNLCVVGDDDQSIYEWRGADVQNILRFEEDYPEAKVIKLEENYRSTKTILALASGVIAHNSLRKDKTLWTQNPQGEKAIFYEAADDRDEAAFIVRQIRDIMAKSDYHYRDFAVLLRTQAQFRANEEMLVQQQLPYRIYGGIKFFQRREIKDVLAYLYVIANPDDAVSMQRIINIPKRGVGPQTWQKILDFHLAHRGQSLVDALADPALKVLAKFRAALARFHDLIVEGRSLAGEGEMAPLVDFVIHETGYLTHLYDRDPTGAEIDEDNLGEFLSLAREFDLEERPYEARTLAGFLEGIALYTDLDSASSDEDSVSVMTMHASKGLEFPFVFVAGFEQDLFPHIRAKNENAGLEEERRLCYVAFTRARDQLFITCARQRLVHGRLMANGPSEFFPELDPAYYTNVSQQRHHQNVVAPSHRKAPAPAAEWRVGEKLLHASWGEGLVCAIDPAEASRITVAFPDKGLKTLDARFAPIRKKEG